MIFPAYLPYRRKRLYAKIPLSNVLTVSSYLTGLHETPRVTFRQSYDFQRHFWRQFPIRSDYR